MPAGGFYALAVDFEQMATKTKLTFYGPSWGWKKIIAAVKDWSEGRAAKCPID